MAMLHKLFLKQLVICFRDFPADWLEVLYDIVELSLDVILNQTCNKDEELPNGYHVNGNEELDTQIVEGLTSCEEQRQCFSKVQEDILRGIIHRYFRTKCRRHQGYQIVNSRLCETMILIHLSVSPRFS